MLHYWTLPTLDTPNAWLTIGSFDGVHRGHQEILKEMVRQSHASNSPAIVLTFYPHPADVLGKRKASFYLNSPEEKIENMSLLGVDHLITHPFNLHVAGLSAWDFVSQLKQKTGFNRMIVGPDFTLGRNREGNLDRLMELGKEMNFLVQPIRPLMMQDRIISSSWVRECLADGDMEKVKSLLGRNFSVRGEIVYGDQRGRSLGFPTANLEIWKKRAIPKNGVYAGLAKIQKDIMPAVVNVGYRPTFNAEHDHPRVEVHILDFEKDIYGCELEVSFIHRLRDEQRFQSANALISQVQNDIHSARKILEVRSDETVS
jgi:riboflavin kinase/FMN adenylyltransferase